VSAQRKSESAGRAGERAIAALLAVCKRAGLGDVKRRPGSARMIGGKLVRTRQGCDFAGHLAGGRAIYLEVKVCAGETSLPYSALRPSQRAELESACKNSACAVVVVLWGPLAMHTSVVPWRAIRTAVLAGKPGSVSLEAWKLPAGKLLLEAKGVTE